MAGLFGAGRASAAITPDLIPNADALTANKLLLLAGNNNSSPVIPVISAPPTSIANLRLWYTAGSITPVADGTAVSSWADSSSVGNTATQATAGQKPLYYNYAANGLPALTFTATNASNMTFTRETDFQTIFFLGSLIDPQTQISGAIIGDTSTIPLGWTLSVGPYLVTYDVQPVATAPSPVRINGKYAGPLGQMCRPTGLCLIVIRVPAGQSMAFATIAMDRITSRCSSQTVAEIALYNRILADYEVIEVENYFMAKYNLSPGVNPAYGARAFTYTPGDSIMLGQGATCHLVYVATLLGGVNRLAVGNYAISGTTAQQWAQTYLGQHQYISNNAIGIPAAPVNFAMQNVSHVWLGTNDLFNSVAAATVYAYLLQIWAYERSQGKLVMAYTIMSRSNSGTPGGFNAARATLNALIRGDPSQYDYLVDVGANQIMGYNGAETNTTYFQSDLVHPTNAGQQIIAYMVYEGYKSLGLA